MLCGKCGKETENESTFCPFCGQRFAGPAGDGGNGEEPKASGRKPGKKIMAGARAAAAVLLIAFGVFRFMGSTSDQERRLWYVRNFSWDTVRNAPVDLSDYRDSASIYCAVECNYNSDTENYFDSELDRALYLADRDYRADTGEPFEDTDDRRLWFLQNYSYDISTGTVIDREIVDALMAYQKYVDEDYDVFKNEYDGGYNLLYIDEDEIPELLATGDCEATGQKLVTYKDGQIFESPIRRLDGVSYAEKKNLYMNENGHMGYYYHVFYQLVDGKQTGVALGEWGDQYDENGRILWNESGEYPVQQYFWNGAECSGEEEYYNAVHTFIQSIIGDTEMKSASFDQHYFNMLEAYDALRTTTCSASVPEK